MTTALYSLSISARATLDLHSLNNEGGEGNQVQTRMVNIVDENRILHNVNAISGDMFKHIQAEHLFHLARANSDSLPLCAGCREFNANRINADADFIARTKGMSDSLLESPFQAPAFSLHPGTLMGYISHWLEIKEQTDPEDLPFAVKWLQQSPDPDQSNRSLYEWREVREKSGEVIGAPLIVVHPKLATYDPQLGLVPDCGGGWEARLPEPQSATHELEDRRGYRLETYEAHIQQVYKAAFEPGGLWEELADAAARIEQRFDLQPNSLRDAAELAVLLHDVGKLSQGWQRWVTTYQKSIGRPTVAGQAYAHTDYQFGNAEQDVATKKAGKRPWHAVEGALATIPLLIQTYEEDNPLLWAIFSAIARHHAPHSANWQEFRLTKDAAQHIVATLADWKLPVEMLMGTKETITSGDVASQLGEGRIAEPGAGENAAFVIYLLLARILRRADQRGTARGAIGV